MNDEALCVSNVQKGNPSKQGLKQEASADLERLVHK